MLCAALALAVAAVLSLWWVRQAAPKVAAPAPAERVQANAASPVLAPAQAPVQTSVQTPVQQPVQQPVQKPAQTPAQPDAQAPGKSPAQQSALQAPIPTPAAAPWPVVVSVSAPLQRASAPESSAAPAATAVIALSALTPEQRRDWPALVLGGSVWSDHAPSRFVIFNGGVWREGDEVSPGVVLDRIGPKAAQLRWRSLRIEVSL